MNQKFLLCFLISLFSTAALASPRFGHFMAGPHIQIAQFGSTRYWSNGTYSSSCNDYKNPKDKQHVYVGAINNGTYRIKIGTSFYDVSCDMIDDGGGWTPINSSLVAGVSGAGFVGSTNEIDGTNRPQGCGVTSSYNFQVTGIKVPYTQVRVFLQRYATILQCSRLDSATTVANVLAGIATAFWNGSIWTTNGMCTWSDGIWAGAGTSASGYYNYWKMISSNDGSNGVTYLSMCSDASDNGAYHSWISVK